MNEHIIIMVIEQTVYRFVNTLSLQIRNCWKIFEILNYNLETAQNKKKFIENYSTLVSKYNQLQHEYSILEDQLIKTEDQLDDMENVNKELLNIIKDSQSWLQFFLLYNINIKLIIYFTYLYRYNL